MKLLKNDIERVLSALAEDAQVFVPGEIGGVKRFTLWHGGTPDLGGPNTALPPKDILFPSTENMYYYKTGKDAGFEEITPAPRCVIFGVRPCDAQSIARMDKVFLGEGITDSYYSKRRENCLIIALSCPEAGENCFCESMGIDPNTADGADILLTDGGDFYSVKANKDKGKDALALLDGLLSRGDAAKGDTHCALKVTLPENISARLPEIFHSYIWDEVSKPCLGCGTCSFICPTCYCFDIGLENIGSRGTAFRCWDSCMFSDYNQIAGGINERPTKKERLRNRYMHKLSYFNERHGVSLCVGCGRCITMCPAHLDITEVISLAAEVLYD